MPNRTLEISALQARYLAVKIQAYNLAQREAQEALALITSGHGIDASTFVSLTGQNLVVDVPEPEKPND